MIPGIKGRVDLNEYNGSVAEMVSWADALRRA